MPLSHLDKACLAFGHVALLDHADFQLDEGERVGLIGRNGGGKSSMMRVLAGQAGILDDGLVWRAPAARICYVSQEPVLAADDSVFDAVASGLGELQKLLHDYHHVSHQLSEAGRGLRHAAGRDAALADATRGAERLVGAGAHRDYHCKTGSDADKRVGELSGGQRNAWRWRRHWWPSRMCCSSTSRPTIWISPPSNGWKGC